MLSNMQIEGVNGLCRILESAITGKPLPDNNSCRSEPTQHDIESKKRGITEITDYRRADFVSNPRKVMKIAELGSKVNTQI